MIRPRSSSPFASVVTLENGDELRGRIIYRTEEELAVASNPYDFAQLVKIPAEQVASVEPSHVSTMPPGTIAPDNPIRIVHSGSASIS